MKRLFLPLLLLFITLLVCIGCGGSQIDHASITFRFADGTTADLIATDAAQFPKEPVWGDNIFHGWQDDQGKTYTHEELAQLLQSGGSLTVTANWEQHLHSLKKGKAQPPTCQEAGYTPYTCTTCGFVKKNYSALMPPIDHQWIPATFELPKHCATCGLSEGTALQTKFLYELPHIELTTDNGEFPKSKEEYLTGSFQLSGSSQYDIAPTVCEIRCRGNYTYDFPPKKAYRIRFQEKTSLFGEAKNRSWTLLADYLDISHIKNFAAYHLASLLDGMDFAPAAYHVNLSLNGEYLGVYMLSDQVDENKGRLDLETDLSQTGEVVPFLLELDDYAEREGKLDIDYFTYKVPTKKNETLKFSIKYPKADERVSPEQFHFIKGLTYTALDAIFGENDLNWRDYWDEDAMIDYFTVNQWLSNAEISYKSVFLSYKPGEKIEMGPVWDFDWALGGPNWMVDNTGSTFSSKGPDYRGNPNGWRSNAWFSHLWKHDAQFVRNFYTRWQTTRLHAYAIIEELKLYKPVIAEYIDLEMLVWDRYQTPEYLNHPYGKASGQYDVVVELLESHTEWMDSLISRRYQEVS